MQIKISDHFTYGRLLKYALSPIIMVVFCSIYSVVDGIFIANYVGKNSLASINIIWPTIMIIGSFGFMLGTGGNAEIAKTYGEGKKKLANEYFSNIIFTVIITGIVLSAVSLLNLEKICYLSGATDKLIDECMEYGIILFLFTPLFLLQNAFQTLSATAEKPKIGLIATVGAGICNILFDYIFIAMFKLGVKGAAIGTVSGYFFGALLPLIYFSRKNSSLFQLQKCKIYPMTILKSCYNGVSEMISNLSGSIINIIFNVWLIKLIGEDGVAAYSAIMYLDYFFKAMIIGYLVGMSPLIAYNYGAKNYKELANIFRKSLVIVIITSVIMLAIAEYGNEIIISLFDGGDLILKAILTNGFKIYGFVYLFAGISMFASSSFTSVSNGFLSGLISMIRTLVLPIVFVNYLAVKYGLNGIWISVPLAECVTAFLSVFLLIFNRKKYYF